MEITILGSGTSQGIPIISCDCRTCTSTDPRDKRLRCSVLIVVENTHIVIDSGPDFRQQMLTCGNKQLDAVLITHEHNDHIIGLDDIRPYNYIQKRSIHVFAQQRVVNDIKNKFAYAFVNRYPGAPQIDLQVVDGDHTFEVKGIKVIPIHVMHNKLPILGYRIGNFAYITDASLIEEIELSKLIGLEYLVINALRPASHPSHFSLDEALGFIKKVNPNQAYLTHISHFFKPQKEWENTLPKNVAIAYDGLKIITQTIN